LGSAFFTVVLRLAAGFGSSASDLAFAVTFFLVAGAFFAATFFAGAALGVADLVVAFFAGAAFLAVVAFFVAEALLAVAFDALALVDFLRAAAFFLAGPESTTAPKGKVSDELLEFFEAKRNQGWGRRGDRMDAGGSDRWVWLRACDPDRRSRIVARERPMRTPVGRSAVDSQRRPPVRLACGTWVPGWSSRGRSWMISRKGGTERCSWGEEAWVRLPEEDLVGPTKSGPNWSSRRKPEERTTWVVGARGRSLGPIVVPVGTFVSSWRARSEP